jgi:hypothetical protein
VQVICPATGGYKTQGKNCFVSVIFISKLSGFSAILSISCQDDGLISLKDKNLPEAW